MKLINHLAAVGAAVAGMLFAGCTSIESTQKFNALGLGTPTEKAVCQTYVEIPGYFFLGLPIITGSPAGDGQWTMFRWSLTTENAVFLLTKEAKQKGAARVVNVHVSTTERSVFPFIDKRTIQASGTGVRSKSAAVDRARNDYDSQP